MNSNSIILQEFLGSLKEDRELDALFPLLLRVMGFRIIQTALESKGQSQYGKDIIAIGKDYNGKEYKWYFELKGFKDRNITQANYFANDGIRESILEAKDTVFQDSSISQFNNLPIKIVLVHNGVLKANIRPTFEGLISKTFKEGEFERWDIYYLTELFSNYLFSEYLLSDAESNRLFKRTLAFLDAPDYDLGDFKNLVDLQIENISSIKGRAFIKFFATLNLLLSIIYHYSKENDNLLPAKSSSYYLILKTWSWILKNNLENKEPVLKEFRKLLKIQYDILNSYFFKTFPVATIEDGLFAENGAFFESIGYPLRCFEYIDDLIYYCQLRLYKPGFTEKSSSYHKIKNFQKDKIIRLVQNNSGFNRPLLDNHSISILNLFLFFSEKSTRRKKDVEFLAYYLFDVIRGINAIKQKRGRFPEGGNRIELVSEYICTGQKPEEYIEDSSILLSSLMELTIVFNNSDFYGLLAEWVEEISLQVPHPNHEEFDIEQRLFEKHFHEEFYVETFNSTLPFKEFQRMVKDRELQVIDYRTDKAGFPFLRNLAHFYFKNEFFPSEIQNVLNED